MIAICKSLCWENNIFLGNKRMLKWFDCQVMKNYRREKRALALGKNHSFGEDES